MDLRKLKTDIEDTSKMITTERCVHALKSIGSGVSGVAYNVAIRGKTYHTSKFIAIKFETENDGKDVEKEFKMLRACSQLILDGICINFLFLYGVFKLNKQFDNKSKNFTDVPAITYGIAMSRAELTVDELLFDRRDKASHPLRTELLRNGNIIDIKSQIFWQVMMSLYVVRTQFGMFHNDAHTGNILLRKVAIPCDVVYINKNISKQRTVHIGAGGYYAMLADFGRTNKVPQCFYHKKLLKLVYYENRDEISDFNRFFSLLYSRQDVSSFYKIFTLWGTIKMLIKHKLQLSKIDLTEDGSGGFANIREMYTMLNMDTCLRGLYDDELALFSDIAFPETESDSYTPGTIVCDVTPPRTLKSLSSLPNCDTSSVDEKFCVWESERDTTIRVKEDTSLKFCKNFIAPPSLPSSEPRKYKRISLSSKMSQPEVGKLIDTLRRERYKSFLRPVESSLRPVESSLRPVESSLHRSSSEPVPN